MLFVREVLCGGASRLQAEMYVWVWERGCVSVQRCMWRQGAEERVCVSECGSASGNGSGVSRKSRSCVLFGVSACADSLISCLCVFRERFCVFATRLDVERRTKLYGSVCLL